MINQIPYKQLDLENQMEKEHALYIQRADEQETKPLYKPPLLSDRFYRRSD